MNRRLQRWILIGIILFFIVLAVVSKRPFWVEHYYANGIYPNISKLNQRLWSWVSFSIGDIGYAVGITFVLFRLFRFSFKRHFWKVINTLGLIVVLFYTSWGLHYFKTPLREQRQLPKTISKTALLQTTTHYAQQTTILHGKLTQSPTEKVTIGFDKNQLLDIATQTMEDSPLRPKNLHGKAKATLFPTLLSYMGFGGYANPFTHEAQVNTLQPKLSIITTGCHEIAHQWGHAAEEDANYVSIKATLQSENDLVAYAGNLMAFRYLLSALHRTDAEQAKTVLETIPEGVLENIRETRAFWERYQNPFEPIFKKSYDQYLKTNQQQEGIKSYSLVVSLLVDDMF